MLFAAGSYAQSDTVNQLPCQIKENQMINHLAKALLDPDMMIGVFEYPGFGTKLRHLKNDIIPESDKEYIRYMNSANLMKLNTQAAIKGNFDSLIFIKYPVFANTKNNNPYQSNPEFHSGSIWVLLLEKGFDKNGSAKADWITKLSEQSPKLFNETTMFLNAFETYYGLCYKWHNDQIKPEFILIDENNIADLTTIAHVLEIRKKERRTEALENMLEKNECLSGCGRLIIGKILLLLAGNK